MVVCIGRSAIGCEEQDVELIFFAEDGNFFSPMLSEWIDAIVQLAVCRDDEEAINEQVRVRNCISHFGADFPFGFFK